MFAASSSEIALPASVFACSTAAFASSAAVNAFVLTEHLDCLQCHCRSYRLLPHHRLILAMHRNDL